MYDSGWMYWPQHPHRTANRSWETLLRRIFAPAIGGSSKNTSLMRLETKKKGLKAQGADFLGSNETQTHKTSPFILGSCVIDHWTTSDLTKRDQWHKAASCALAKPDVCKHSCSPCLDGCQFTKSGQPLIKGSDDSDGQKHPQVQTMAHFLLLNHALLGAQYYFEPNPHKYGSK